MFDVEKSDNVDALLSTQTKQRQFPTALRLEIRGIVFATGKG